MVEIGAALRAYLDNERADRTASPPSNLALAPSRLIPAPEHRVLTAEHCRFYERDADGTFDARSEDAILAMMLTHVSRYRAMQKMTGSKIGEGPVISHRALVSISAGL